MRRPLAYGALLAALALAACSDTTPTATSLVRGPGSMGNLTVLETYIQTQIDIYLPQGFEDAVDARWATVQRKKAAGDMAGAIKTFNTLASWIDKKTADITPPDLTKESKAQAAARLVLNMGNWLYFGENTPVVELKGKDAALEFVPAGAVVNFTTPAQQAGFRLEAGSTAEDRVILIVQDETDYPGNCNGPLVTRRCQYPLFYEFKSFPANRFLKPAKFAVCMVTRGDRRPLERLADEVNNPAPVHARMRLAHELPAPANQGAEADGFIHEDGIEILPKSATQLSLTNCEAPNVAAMRPMERALYAVTRFAERLLGPKSLYAYDSGPEHDGLSMSHFNAVDPVSSPDLAIASLLVSPSSAAVGTAVTVSYVVENRSRRSGGEATAASSPTHVTAWLSSDQTISEDDISLGSAVVPAMLPDATPFPVLLTFNAPATGGTYYVIVKVDANTPLAEYSLVNNTVTAQLTVTVPNTIPNPILAYRHSEQYSVGALLFDRYTLTVTNRASFPSSMFAPAPDLPPCGGNTSASQSWVDIYDGSTGANLNSFCALGSPDNLNDIWFAVPRWTQPPASVYIKITDRRTNLVYTSNTINLYGPLFVNFPRVVELDWSAVDAVSYDIQVDYCESWASPDWTTCNVPWTTGARILGYEGGTSYVLTFVGDQPGRWRVAPRDVSGNVGPFTAYKYFNYITGSGAP